MKCVAVASFAGGLLLGSCIALVGLRGFLLRQDTLLRQSLPRETGTITQCCQQASWKAPPWPVGPQSSGRVPPPPSPDSPGQDPSGVRECRQRSCLGVTGGFVHWTIVICFFFPWCMRAKVQCCLGLLLNSFELSRLPASGFWAARRTTQHLIQSI